MGVLKDGEFATREAEGELESSISADKGLSGKKINLSNMDWDRVQVQKNQKRCLRTEGRNNDVGVRNTVNTNTSEVQEYINGCKKYSSKHNRKDVVINLLFRRHQ